jgi:multiple sugar transport system permease protein
MSAIPLAGGAATLGEAVAPTAVGSREPRRRSRTAQIVYWAALLGLAALFLYPFAWLVSASFKPRAEVFDNRLIPLNPTLDNFVQVWNVAPMLTWFVNSTIVAVLAAASVTVSSAMVAFGFAYFRFPLRNVMFGLVLATMMLPGMVTMIPVFLIWKDLGALNTRLPLWGTNLFGSPFYIFLLRQFFLTLPRELFDAARIDGCSNFGLFRRIAVPLSKPALIMVFVFEIQASWNDLLKPLIYLRDVNLYTIPLGLNSLFVKFNPVAGGEGDFQYIVTAALLSTVPMVVIFAVCQRYFVDGIAATARQG